MSRVVITLPERRIPNQTKAIAATPRPQVRQSPANLALGKPPMGPLRGEEGRLAEILPTLFFLYPSDLVGRGRNRT